MKWYLEVTSWASFNVSATHFYGLLRSDLSSSMKCINLEYRIGHKEALRRNRLEGRVIWFPDDLTRGFLSVDAVKKTAITKFKEISKIGDLLLYGSFASADPMLVLAGPQTLMDQLNVINAAWKDIDGWRGPKQVAQKLSEQWDLTLSEIKDEGDNE